MKPKPRTVLRLLTAASLVWAMLWPSVVLAQTRPQTAIIPIRELFHTVSSANTSSTCFQVPSSVRFHTLTWRVSGTVSAGTVKLVGSNTATTCASPSDIIAAQDATMSGHIFQTEASYRYIKIVPESIAGTGFVDVWWGGDNYELSVTAMGIAGTEYTEDAAAAANPVAPALTLVRADTPGAVSTTNGDNVALRGTNYGAAYVQIVTSTGSFVDAFSGGTQYTEDAAAAANPVATAINLVRVDTPVALVTTDGDNVAARGNNFGAMYVTLLNQSGAYALPTDSADNAPMSAAPVLTGCGYIAAPADHTDLDAATALCDIKGRQVIVGAGTAGTATGGVVTVQGVASGTALNTVIGAGSALIGKVDIQSNGTAIPLVADPCDGTSKTTVPFSISSATTFELANALASNYIIVCGFDIVVGAANNVALVEDDTDACASPTAGMAGGTTAATGWNFAANGGMIKGNGNSTIFRTAAVNRYMCLMTSTTAQTSGSIQFVFSANP